MEKGRIRATPLFQPGRSGVNVFKGEGKVGGMTLPVFDEVTHDNREVIALFSEDFDYPVFDEMPLENVIWDEESGHEDLLDQLAQDENYLVAVVMQPTVHPTVVEKQLQHGINRGCFEMPTNTDGAEDLIQNHDVAASDVKLIGEDEVILTKGKYAADWEILQAREISEEGGEITLYIKKGLRMRCCSFS
jgi:hypothetical protein